MVKSISQALMAALLAAMALACAPMLAFAGGSSINDPIAVEIGGSQYIELSEDGQQEAWFTFTVGQEGDYVAYASTDACLDTKAELCDSRGSRIAESDEQGEEAEDAA